MAKVGVIGVGMMGREMAKTLLKSGHTVIAFDTGPGFSVAKLLDLEVLVMGGGRERTIDEYKTLLGAAGFGVSKMIPTKIGPTMLDCLMG